MTKRPLAILLLVALLVQSAFAGLPGRAIVLCLGAGHAASGAAMVEAGCAHEAGAPAPEHEEACPDGCTDLVVKAGELQPAPPGEPLRVAAPAAQVIAPMLAAAPSRPVALGAVDPDPGDTPTTSMLRATRLLI